MTDIYENVRTFKEERQKDRQTQFKVNKAFEVENKVLPRIIANNPKRLVSIRKDSFSPEDDLLTPEARFQKMQDRADYTDAIRDYLTTVFNKYDLAEVMKMWAKGMVRYGLSWAKVCYRYEVNSTSYNDISIDF